MADEISISHMMRERQLQLAHILSKQGYSLKAISIDSGIKYSTLRSYFPGERDPVPAVMPVTALYQLIGCIPDELLSLLLPDGRSIVEVPEDIDHDEACRAMQDYLLAKSEAHHPESENGREIGPREDARLRGKLVPLRKQA